MEQVILLEQSPFEGEGDTESEVGINLTEEEIINMEFWVYENWTVVAGGKARVHRGECRYCNHGTGQRIYPNPSGRNGRWHGPFTTENDAMNYANNLGRRDVRRCRVC